MFSNRVFGEGRQILLLECRGTSSLSMKVCTSSKKKEGSKKGKKRKIVKVKNKIASEQCFGDPPS